MSTIHFQWQNEFLLKSIYPRRELKLRDFLVYDYEISLWNRYKGKSPQDMPDELEEYLTSQREMIEDMFRQKGSCDSFFSEGIKQLIASSFSPPRQGRHGEVERELRALQDNYSKHFSRYQNAAKERAFLTNRASEIERLENDVRMDIQKKQRILDNPNSQYRDKEAFEQDLERLRSQIYPLVAKVLQKLKEYLAVYEKLDKYERVLNQQLKKQEKDYLSLKQRLASLITRRRSLQNALENSLHARGRLENSPDKASLATYFCALIAADHPPEKYTQVDSRILQKISALHRTFNQYFPNYTNPIHEKHFVNRMVEDIEKFKSTFGSRLLAGTPDWEAVTAELNLLLDLRWSYAQASYSAQEIQQMISRETRNEVNLREQLAVVSDEENQIVDRMTAYENRIQLPRKDQILSLVDPTLTTTKEIIANKVLAYRRALETENHTRLLEMIVRRFISQPECYPLWLQYMVIHFSGMRYRSAHGSWADARDILAKLCSLRLEEEMQNLTGGPGAIKQLSLEKFNLYQRLLNPASITELLKVKDLGPDPTALHAPEWKKKFEKLVASLAPDSRLDLRRALLDLRKVEAQFRIQHLDHGAVLDELRELKPSLPAWTWKEIVANTELRATEVNNQDWETFTQQEIADRSGSRMVKYRQAIDEWKSQHLTAWRNEHSLSKEIIVSRAVCNEIAEHIQHLRGLKPSGGLTQKINWYRAQEKLSDQLPPEEKAYLKKMKHAKDVRVGAALFWLRWVDKPPHPDQIARPFTLPDGEDLIPALRAGAHEVISDGSAYHRLVTFQESGSEGERTRTKRQWLRWMHEAMVARTAETSDGQIVLTFETSLPDSDRSLSTIGVAKRAITDLVWRASAADIGGCLVGFVPQQELDFAVLKDVLDWNKILGRRVFTKSDINAYWQKVLPLAEGLDCREVAVAPTEELVTGRVPA